MKKPLTMGLLMDFMLPAIIDGAGAYVRQHALRLDARWSVRADWMPEQPAWDGLLADVAQECGFSSVHYFSNAFKRETGVTPGQFR